MDTSESVLEVRGDHPLHAVAAKLARADGQINELERDVRRFIDLHKEQTIEGGREEGTGERIARYVAPTLPAVWGVQFGEILHNLRSAMDNAVWQLVIQDGGAPRVHQTGFPVCSQEHEFKNAKKPGGLWKLSGMKHCGVDVMRRYQPFRAGDNQVSLVRVLHDLWNIDKHRTVHLVVPHAELIELRLNVDERERPRFRLARLGRLRHGDELFRAPPDVSGEIELVPRLRMTVVVDEASGVDSRMSDVSPLLRAIYGTVARMITDMHALFRA